MAHALLSTIIAAAALGLLSCRFGEDRAPAAEAVYAGSHELALLGELSPEAEIVARVHHGDKLRILERRRRFVRVRSADGHEGWVDGHALLSAEQMSRLRRLSLEAASMPSHGAATVFSALNVHATPHRQAPSFFQLQEGDRVEVVAQRIEPRTPYRPEADDSDLLGQPPWRLPPDWTPPPEGADEWALVRIPDGRAGWVLAPRLVMAIPDEVAQYAEGHRITSYFALGAVRDQEQMRHHWLWTTVAGRLRPYDFDSFRVFVWNARRRRYETAHIERNLTGYFPVEVRPGAAGRAGGEPTRFSLLLRERDGRLWRRTYAFAGHRVRLEQRRPWDPPLDHGAPLVVEPTANVPPDGEGQRPEIRRRIRSWFE